MSTKTDTINPVWPRKIEVLGVTGKWSSGKTVFITSIVHPSRCRLYDMEKSASPYEDMIEMGLDRVDVPDELLKLYGKQGYSQKDLFVWWLKHVSSLKQNEVDVIAIDPADELEAGLTDYVKSQYKRYGFTTAEKFASMKGIFWNEVKKEWKRILVGLASKCQTLAFSAHLKQVWRNGEATDQLIPKGKSTFMELAALYLFLERDVLGQDDERDFAQEPSAIVLKTRLGRQVWSKKESKMITTPLLPPRLPIATPSAICEYLVKPPDYENLLPEEKTVEKKLSDSDKLSIQAKIAEDQRISAEATRDTAGTEFKKEEARRMAREKLKPPKIPVTVVTDETIEYTKIEQELKKQREKIKNKLATEFAGSFEETVRDTKVSVNKEKNLTKKISSDEVSSLLEAAKFKHVKERVIKAIKKELNMADEHIFAPIHATSLTRKVFDQFVKGVDKV